MKDLVTLDKSPARLALERANSWFATANGLVEAGKAVRNRWRERHNFSVTVDSTDVAYQDVHDWLLSRVPADKQRALAAYSERRADRGLDVGPADDAPPVELHLTYDVQQEQTVEIRGRQVRVHLSKASAPATQDGRYTIEPDRIVFRCTSQTTQQAVVDQLRTIVENRGRRERKAQLWLMSQWGGWRRRSDIPLRTTESVILREGQMENLADDLGGFLASEADYVRRGIPWHRGYLLQGPPGTGKTSIAKALAHRFNLDLWYAPLGDLSKDSNLLALLSEVRQRSILLLEDVDIYHAATTREAEAGRVTLSGLLNALDGVATPHGLITILTSNEPKALDEALVRPGRVDRVEDIDYVTQEQAERLFAFFYGRPSRGGWRVDAQTSTAELTELFKRHMDDPDGAERTLRFGRLVAK